MVPLLRASRRRVFITGCSSGLGRSTALHLAHAGMDVVATTRRTDDADQLRQIAAQTGIPLIVILLDLLDEQSIRNGVADAAQHLGGIDVLINNAGVELIGPIEQTSDEEFCWQFDTNVPDTFRTTKGAIPLLRASNHATLIFISSVMGFAARPFLGAYSASKYAIEGLAEALYFELQPFHISVTLVEPDNSTVRWAATNESLVTSPPSRSTTNTGNASPRPSFSTCPQMTPILTWSPKRYTTSSTTRTPVTPPGRRRRRVDRCAARQITV